MRIYTKIRAAADAATTEAMFPDEYEEAGVVEIIGDYAYPKPGEEAKE